MKGMSEAALQDVAADFLRFRGWLVFHVRPARTERGWRTPGQYDAQGFPDLACARGGQVELIEVKSGRGKTTPHQDAWLTASNGFLLTPKTLDELMERYR